MDTQKQQLEGGNQSVTRKQGKRRQSQLHNVQPEQKKKEEESQNKDEKKLTGWESIKETLNQVLEHNITTAFMTIITIYALFGDDIRILTTNKYGDPYFWGFNIAAMVFFFIELIIASLAKDKYFNSFFFWLDAISTLSLLLDIGWFSQLIFENGDASGASSAAQLARAGRASRIGTKAGRIVRIVRLIRLVKLYKHASDVLVKEVEQDEVKELENGPQSSNMPIQNSKPLQRQLTRQKDQASNPQHTPLMNPNQGMNQSNNGNNPGSALSKKDDTIKEKKSINNQKLPPLPVTNNQQEVDGPSKPIILDKFKNDPLLQLQGDTERQGEENIARVHPIKDQKQNTGDRSPFTSKDKQLSQKEDSNQNAPEPAPIPQETKVGQKLSDLTTRRVITLVLSIMVSIPLFTTSTWVDPTVSYDIGLNTIYMWNQQPVLMRDALDNFIDFHKDERSPIIYLKFEYDVPACCQVYPTDAEAKENSIDDYEELRSEEYNIYTIYNKDDQDDVIAFTVKDGRIDNDLNAILSIVRTVFVSVVLSAGAMSFSRDVEQLVLEPIENMVNKVQRIADNPLEAAQMEENEAFIMQDLKKQKNFKEIQKKQEEDKMETVILERLIIKIGALLAVGFGEAGSEIIASNMQKGGAVDPMIPGIKIMAIFGFCDIRNFTDATEVLQTGVMVFVNEIAEITHGCVDEFCGQSNKNIGDAFLLVWKYNANCYTKLENGDLKLKSDKFIQRYSDLPVLCFVKIMAHLANSNKLIKYKNNAGLNERIPDYNQKGVRMGFGLHCGWGIEGAIGSEFKIDASYLSPNVNMASRLEAATKQFGTGLLISGALYQQLTPELQQELRHIDRVTVKGSIEPMDLYTCDVSYDLLLKHKKQNYKDKYDTSKLNQIQKKKKRVLDRIKRNRRRKEIEDGSLQIQKQFHQDNDLVLMRQIFQEEFYQKWKDGFQLYLDGKWPEALQIFKQTRVMYESQGHIDGCSNTLIDVIEENGNKAPGYWNGFRILVEK